MGTRSLFRICSTVCCIVLCAGAAEAQFEQYTPPGGPQARPESREARLKQEIAEARYHLGPVRIAPQAGIRDVAYVRNLFGSAAAESDLTATAFAGARAFLSTGSHVTWIANVQPQYVWWSRRADARRLNTSYGIEEVGLFNRLFLGFAASRDESQRLITPEVPQLFNFRTDVLQANAEVKLTGAIYAFAAVRETAQKNLVKPSVVPLGLDLSRLDRTELVTREGVRWRPSPGWTLGLGAEQSRTDFDHKAGDNSNSGTAPVAEMIIDRHYVSFQLDAAARSLRAQSGSRFVSFDGLTGSASASYRPRRGLEFWIYGNRSLVYSLTTQYPYLDDRRTGVAVWVGAGDVVSSRFFVEAGTDDYIRLSPETAQRSDQVRSYGAVLRLAAVKQVIVAFQAIRSQYVSNLAFNSRSYTSGGVTVTLGSNL